MLSPGSRLGAYEIVVPLGAGGMGEVYRAKDLKLGRDVAIKVLPASFSADRERVARFTREAQVLASLNHSRIGAIYGLEEANGSQFLILELVDGETLDKRIARGPLPVDETLELGKQIAEALEVAHEKGIIHRDLKPSNIALTDDGHVKILDFGLAKLAAKDASLDSASASLSPTITSPALVTGAGMLLGTAAYMSPEQAKGRDADKRSDVWAFGCVLYEMLTGSRAFDGDDMTDVLGAVVRLEPDWQALPSDVPSAIGTLLRRCLVKDRRIRIGDIAVARFVLEHQTDFGPTKTVSAVMPRPPLRRRIVPVLVSALLIVALTGGAVWYATRAVPEPRVVTRFTQPLDSDTAFTRLGRPLVAISPDGTQTVFVANQQLYVRRLNELKAIPLVGTNTDPNTPFFSPDGQWIGYWSFRDGKLMRIPTAGGAPVAIAAADIPLGASWGGDGTIVFGQTSGVMRVSADGGTPQLIVKTGPNEQVHGPQVLPDGRTLLFTITAAVGPTRWDQAEIVVQPLAGGGRKTIWKGGSDARFVASGHIVYALRQTLLAVPFDLSSLTTTAAPVAMVEGVLRAEGAAGNTAAANYAVSQSGTLVYVPAIGGATRTIVAVDATGKSMPLLEEARDYLEPQVSPDGKRIAVAIVDPASDSHIWIIDIASGVGNPLTVDGTNVRPAWTPDGKNVVFRSRRRGGPVLFLQAADGSSAARPLAEGTDDLAGDISKNGVLAFYRTAAGNSDVYTLALTDAKETMFVATKASERTPSISPDGRWVAYVSDERGRDDIYVRPYPPSGSGKWLLSDGGGFAPQWSPMGDAVYYISPSGMLMSVNVEAKNGLLRHGQKELFQTSRYVVVSTNNRPYDVHPDGRFIFVAHQSEGADVSPQRINFVQNWFEELKRLVPTS
jgi:eukaryotic-like serine/threonine-protein kinase